MLEVVAPQPDLLSRVGNGAQEETNLALFVYDAACLLTVLWVTPKPPTSWDSCKRMSSQARSCWFNDL
jgi:hypothetical protein